MNVIRPNDVIADADYAIVIDSFVKNDEGEVTEWGCLLMHDTMPYYQVTIIAADDNNAVDRHKRHVQTESDRFDSLNDAFKEYRQLIMASLMKR